MKQEMRCGHAHGQDRSEGRKATLGHCLCGTRPAGMQQTSLAKEWAAVRKRSPTGTFSYRQCRRSFSSSPPHPQGTNSQTLREETRQPLQLSVVGIQRHPGKQLAF
jgi:hypothetical protein